MPQGCAPCPGVSSDRWTGRHAPGIARLDTTQCSDIALGHANASLHTLALNVGFCLRFRVPLRLGTENGAVLQIEIDVLVSYAPKYSKTW